MANIQYPKDTSVNPSISAVLGAWQNLQIILGQQVQRYIQSVNIKNKNNKRGVSISDINGLLTFLENTINNTLSVSLKQSISISKLRTGQNNNKLTENNMKQTFRLNERELHRLISESVKRVLNESAKTYGVLDTEGEVVATFRDYTSAEQFLEMNKSWCDVIVPMGSNGYIMPYEDADPEQY